MTTSSKPKGLDPRLERLTKRSTEELPVLQWRSSFTANVPEAPLVVRVLVQLGNESDALVLAKHSPSKLHDRLYAATVPVGSLRDLALDPRVVFVEAGRQIGTDLDSSALEVRVNQVRPNPPQPGFDGTDVVIGIIDFGFDYTLDDFRDAAGNTRVKFLWDQSLVPTPAEHSPGAFPHGVEYDSAAINTALAAANPFSLLGARRGGRGVRISEGARACVPVVRDGDAAPALRPERTSSPPGRSGEGLRPREASTPFASP